jgi:hypothetical protein
LNTQKDKNRKLALPSRGGQPSNAFVSRWDTSVLTSASVKTSGASREAARDLNDEDFKTANAVLTKSYESRRSNLHSKDTNILPHIDASERTVYVPDTYDKEDNVIMASMVSLAKTLDYNVSKLPYGERVYETPAESVWQIAVGMGFAPLDFKNKFLIKEKSDMYEQGRTIARAQQLLGYFNTEKKLGAEALRRDQMFFGNNPTQTTSVGKTQYPVRYVGKILESCFAEIEWASYLAPMYLVLLRKSWTLLDKEILESSVKDVMLQYTDVLDLFAKRETVIVPQKGKTAAVSVRKVPKKPKVSSLLKRTEYEFLDRTLTKVFSAIDQSSRDDWYNHVMAHGFSTIKKRIIENANVRAQILQRFASMTTKRLNELRQVGPHVTTVRKRDVQPTDLNTMLLRREKPVDRFADELISLDPTFTSILVDFRVEESGGSVNYQTSRQKLINLLSTKELYKIALDSDKKYELDYGKVILQPLSNLYQSNKENFIGQACLLFHEKRIKLTSQEDLEIIVRSLKDYANKQSINKNKITQHLVGWLDLFEKKHPDIALLCRECFPK